MFPRYQRAGGPVRSLLPFRVLKALRHHRGGHKAKGIRQKQEVGAQRLSASHEGAKGKSGKWVLIAFGFTAVGIFCLLPFAFQGVASVRNPKSTIQNRVSALRRFELGQGHGQAIGARMHGSAPWKTEETIVGLPRLLIL